MRRLPLHVEQDPSAGAQPLDERAEGYATLYDELRRRLESDDINTGA